MNDFEKIEKLRSHADITFEEAKEALDASNGDLLDAVIYLERRGKVNGPSQRTYSTSYEEQPSYESVEKTIRKNEEEQKDNVGKKTAEVLKTIWRFLTANYFVISRNGEEKAVLPLILAIILFFISIWISFAALIVLLFFGFRYSFRGKDNLESVNDTIDKAAESMSGFADKVKQEISKNMKKES